MELPDRGELFVRHVEGPPGAPTVMLLHGWTVTADLNWYPAYEPLSQRASIVAFDHRGHGLGLPTRRFRLSDCAADALAVADTLGIDRFTVAGYSMGGAVAQLVARSAPDRVSGLVLAATSTSFRGQGWRAVRFGLLPVIASTTRFAPSPIRRWGFERTVVGSFGPRMGRWAQSEVLKGDPQAFLDAGTELFNFDSSSWIGDLSMPMAQVRTVGDGVVPDRLQLMLAEAVPGISVNAYRGGHESVVTDFDSFWACMSAALDSIEAAADPERQSDSTSRPSDPTTVDKSR